MSDHEHPLSDSENQLNSPGYLSFSRQFILGILGTAMAGGIGAVLTTLLYTDGMRRLMLASLVAVAFVLSISLGSLFFILIQHLTRAGWAVLIRRPAEVFALNVITVGVLAIPIVVFAFCGSASIYPWARGAVGEATKQAQSTEHTRLQPNPTVRMVSTQIDSSSDADKESERARSHGDGSLGAEQLHSGNDAQEDLQAHLYAHQTFDELTASKTPWLNPTFFSLRLILYFGIWSGISWFYFSD